MNPAIASELEQRARQAEAQQVREKRADREVERILREQFDPLKQGKGASLTAISMASVHRESVSWLWYSRIPLGKLTMLEGDPGVGKSFITDVMAAAVSLGRGLPGQEATDPANVLMLSAEDGLGDTVRPRLEQGGADLSRVFAIEKPITLDYGGCKDLLRIITEHKPRLVTLDPIFAYAGGRTNIDRANESRAITARLHAIANHTSCAIVGVRHLTKGSRDKSIYRGGGSIDWTAACRSVLLAGLDPQDRRRRAIVHIKSNLGPMADPVGYSIEEGEFAWTGVSDLSAEAMLANEEHAAEEASALDEAIEFLRATLAQGAVLQNEIMREAREAGISERTLRRAKNRLKVRANKRIGDGKWEWAQSRAGE